jgi:hypothetical protein
MKAGPGALIFSYTGGATSGGGGYTPNNSAGIQAAISHIEFCRYGRFTVGVTDPTSYTRDYDWTIDKQARAPMSVGIGSPLLVAYTVSMARDSVDFDFAITGTISVSNTGHGTSGIVQGVSVEAAGVMGDVMCDGFTFPTTLADGSSFICDYTIRVPDASTRIVTATVTVDESDPWRSSSATVTAVFGEPTLLIDDVVTIFDTRVPSGLGTLTAPGTIVYSVTYGPYTACVPVQIDNIASFVTDDNGEVGADAASVTVDVTECSDDDSVVGTAFAFSGDQTTSFSALGLASRWGWTINFGGSGAKTYDVYVGAGRNDLSKGTPVGTVTITYTGSAVNAVYNLLPGYSVLEQHLYAGSLMAPQVINGKRTSYTVAPGRYTVNVAGGNIWVIAHSVIGYIQP